MKRNLFIKSVLALSLMQASIAYSGAFHTIIGPDGRPMVVQLPDAPVKKKVVVQKTEAVEHGSQNLKNVEKALITQSNAVSLDTEVPDEVVVSTPHFEPTPHISAAQEQNLQQVAQKLKAEKANVSVEAKPNNPSKAAEVSKQQSKVSNEATLKTVAEQDLQQPLPTLQIEKNIAKTESQAAPVKADSKPETIEISHAVIQSIQKNEQPKNSPFKVLPQDLVRKPESAVQSVSSKEMSTGFSAMDGEQYVNSEYLEDKEFNLDGKKRFYAMPEGVIDNKIGATRMQMVEREKGVSKSVIESMFKRNQPVDTGPITLATTYYRVSKAEAVSGLGQQCFQEKQTKNAKNLKAHADANVWPRAPLKAQFDFEIVKIDASIQNIQIKSYASKQNNPTFYWPFVVFLDAKGCVLEGAGGYKNKDGQENNLRHESIEGVIQIPEKTQYILMTPLASAIDVEQRALTNYGQLKLIAIR
ncbi:putative pilus assembly protein FilE [Acinetobacter sp. ANC 3813]|uniref:putative pilus assembly protein FilE n=1 Tax=Acinetobacter sp. ANC 3813 TaxID=1977873 RepID=UPI000A339E4F|nr:putative pilus assembly protein FilE [Acinetobacter sp. ANC 3813]OTG89182.1 hypothetical protein B9T34_13360 [Acinetobacter sp. ANC 3813]